MGSHSEKNPWGDGLSHGYFNVTYWEVGIPQEFGLGHHLTLQQKRWRFGSSNFPTIT